MKILNSFVLLLLLDVETLRVTANWIDNPAGAKQVQDFEGNPILKAEQLFEWILGDPTSIQIGDEMHLFCNTVFHGILHYVAPVQESNQETFNFTHVSTPVRYPGSVRPFAHYDAETDTVSLMYEQYELLTLYRASKIMLVQSTKGGPWTKPSVVLEPSLEWELIGTKRVGNPFVYQNKTTGKYVLFYSASSIHLNDSNIDEPLHLGAAESDTLRGPYRRITSSPIDIDDGPNALNYIGVGSLKLVDAYVENNLALMNRITLNASDGATGSTISTARIEWDESTGVPSIRILIDSFIAPTTPAAGWKSSYVYGFDTLTLSGRTYTLIFYNARDGWKTRYDGPVEPTSKTRAVETIGVSRTDFTEEVSRE